jgi:hypothetical protein
MSETANSASAERTYLLPWSASVLLSILACGWGLAFLFSASEPSLVAAVIGIPTFLATPVVTLGFVLLLWRRRGHSTFHRTMFYCSACFFAVWAVFALVGVMTQ